MARINELFVIAMSRYGIKSKELAELIGISAQQVTEFRRGRSWVSQETFESMLESMEHLSPGSKRYFCSLLANEDIGKIDNKQKLIDMIENANAEEIEAVLLAIGRRWNKDTMQSKTKAIEYVDSYAEIA